MVRSGEIAYSSHPASKDTLVTACQFLRFMNQGHPRLSDSNWTCLLTTLEADRKPWKRQDEATIKASIKTLDERGAWMTIAEGRLVIETAWNDLN